MMKEAQDDNRSKNGRQRSEDKTGKDDYEPSSLKLLMLKKAKL